MKKFLIVVGVIFAVAVVAFGISVAATGVNMKEGIGIHFGGLELIRIEGGTNMKKGENYSSAFTKEQCESVNHLKISTTSAETTISCDESIDEIRVSFTSNRPGTTFTADIINDELVINESGFGFWFIFWWTGGENRLDVTLPKAEYEKMTLGSTSGTVKVDGLIFEDFNSTSTSGTSEYNIFADNIKAFTTSGRTTITNCTDRKASSLSFDTTSGSHTINGFTADKFHIGSTSGKIVANGISGKGDVSLTSGKIQISYSEWNDDLKIDITSGTCVVNLPEGSNVGAKLDALSGGMTINYADGQRISLSNDDSVSLGGENCHEIKADLTSGSVKVNVG